ncbi:ABC transporter permease [Kribbella hippodromi]|uniref:ABC transporter permease n=1 Tax=Kribbella hippodromi TaxID=434347 RepID=A0ABP4PJQ1_9ACTN
MTTLQTDTLADTPVPATEEPALALASQRTLIWRRFKRNKLAVVSLWIVGFIYFTAAFCEFLAPQTQDTYASDRAYAPPQLMKVSLTSSPHLFVNGYKGTPNPETLLRDYTVDKSQRYGVRLFAKGDHYKLWGLIPSDRHLLGPSQPGAPFHLLGTDDQGRDNLSRVIYGTRISMSVGLIGVSAALVLGLLLGGISGYFGGLVDGIVQRVIEFFMSIPTLPLWLGLAAAVPPGWSALKTYFAITLILSLIGWTGLARVIRSRFLQIRDEDFVLAAELDGARWHRVVGRHMLPAFTSHIIASLTLAVPGMILGETALSFLGLGLQPPVVSWGVLLSGAQSIRVLTAAPWLLAAGAAVVIAVMALNFVGDGLRDAADPYES